MRVILLSVACVAIATACAWLAESEAGKPAEIRVFLVDEASGAKISGIVRVLSMESGKAVALPGLLDRMRGFKTPDEYSGWHVLPAEGATISLPPGKYRLQGLCGLETALAERDLDLSKGPGGGADQARLPLNFLFRPEERGLVAGNTHLHLMKISKKEADDYLRQVPAADRLRVLFISHLERKPDDVDYVTNTYPTGRLEGFDATGVLISNGEEHRHNFKAYGQGYGHVMFLDIKKLVQPVSIGPGIMGKGFDDTPLAPGIEEARKQGGTVIWCHNTSGYEDVLNALAGRLDAINVFDGSRTGDYEGNYYRYLNVGIRLPISTGTDWFMYDFSRVYAEVRDAGKATIPMWLDAVKAGRCQATNGPLLSLHVEDQAPGGVVKLARPGRVKVAAAAVGRLSFGKLELIWNGKVMETANASAKAPFRAEFKSDFSIDQPGWFALRVTASDRNEMGQTLFAHTSPVYVEMSGQTLFHVDDGLELLKQIEEGAGAIRAQGAFSTAEARAALLTMYDRGARALREQINKARK